MVLDCMLCSSVLQNADVLAAEGPQDVHGEPCSSSSVPHLVASSDGKLTISIFTLIHSRYFLSAFSRCWSVSLQ